MGIRDRPISPGSPWQNPYVERLIGTVRRECLDRMLIFGESHLRQILSSYAAYYNQIRTHLALGKNTPSLPLRTSHGRGVWQSPSDDGNCWSHSAARQSRGLSFPKIPSGLGFAS